MEKYVKKKKPLSITMQKNFQDPNNKEHTHSTTAHGTLHYMMFMMSDK
jgi:hypothetical protein